MPPTETVPVGAPLRAAPVADRTLLWIVLALLFAGVNLRPMMTSLGALLETVRLELAISSTAVGVLASLPTFCMGALALMGGWVIVRVGIGAGMRRALALIALGCLLRLGGHWLPMLFLATLIGGLGIAAVQLLIPVVIKQYFASRTALVMGGVTALMNVGAAVGAAAMPSLSELTGGWHVAMAWWALPALLAALFWPGSLRQPPATEPMLLPWRSALAWRMALFLGTGSIAYMSLLAWMVPVYVASGHSEQEGVMLLSLYAVAQIVGSLLLPPWANRYRDRRPFITLSLLILAFGVAGLLWLPAQGIYWAFLAGLGLGGSFPLALTLPLDYTRTPAQAGRYSAMVQGVAMLMGATGPILFGMMRDGLGISAALVLLLVSVLLSILLGLGFRPAGETEEHMS